MPLKLTISSTAYAQVGLSLCWSHIPHCWKSHVAASMTRQWCSQSAEKVRHTKGRLLDQAVILFNASFFEMGTSLKGINFLPEGANSFL